MSDKLTLYDLARQFDNLIGESPLHKPTNVIALFSTIIVHIRAEKQRDYLSKFSTQALPPLKTVVPLTKKERKLLQQLRDRDSSSRQVPKVTFNPVVKQSPPDYSHACSN